ncbi:ATP-dependent DNA helicase Q4 [Melopsittacus undulatus]|uniref:ATP-dependent DNA helicase Q4 n=1 Tax=Melopsittacus undulatus TaxID=13146 RepID=A0A8V5H1C1_MELUD|nr:ATP-dependent DNA helicase Q4 [Melopsittacus undulatus]
MERLREVRAALKRWEKEFEREQSRKPGQADIQAAPEETRRLYREYRSLKQQTMGSDPSQPEPSNQSASQEQVPDSGSWGSHLNRQPKTPQLSPSVPRTSVQSYGMKLKSKLGAAGKETPLTPRRIPAPGKSPLIPKLWKSRDATTFPTPTEHSQWEEAKGEDLLLPASVSGLAPVILAAGLKPSRASQASQGRNRSRALQETLGSLDPAWIRRCQGASIEDGMEPGMPQEEGGGGESRADSKRKRPRGDGEWEDPEKLQGEGEEEDGKRRKRKKRSKEEGKEEPKELRKAMEPLENLLGEVEEEEEKPRSRRKVLPARAIPKRKGNFVRLNLRSRSHVRSFVLRGNRLRKQMWKQKWQKKSGWFGGGGSMRNSDVCFRCGGTGHWASECRGASREAEQRDPAPKEEEEEEEEAPLPTLEEVARRTNSFCPELSGSHMAGSNGIWEASTSRDAWKPVYEAPAAPAPMEPLYSLRADGKVQETPKEVMDALKAFGYSSFRPGQEVAIMRILSGLSTLVVLSTGMGKSLCYQLPAYLYHQRSKCITLVISPLVSLMDDQISGLPRCLKAVCIHSNMPKSQREAVMEKVLQGKVHILLLSPEAVVGGSGSGGGFLPSADRLPPVAFVCIDEAHCLSQWSHNFRPCYLRLCKVLRDRLGIRCFLGLTATATLATARDVLQHLGIPAEEGITVHSAAVPSNLLLSVSMDRDRDEALISLLQGERFGSLDSIIVYCTRREETTRIAALIRTCLQGIPLREKPGARDHQQEPVQGRKAKAKRSIHDRFPMALADSYHAGLSGAERRRVQSGFMSGRIRVVVATVAFGMGLDKADVQGVIHYNMPKSLECYVQEIGRAGRDGAAAHCHLFLDPEGGDLPELRRHIYGDSVDFLAIKRLVLEAFGPCKCRELHRNHREVTKADELEDAELLQEAVGEEELGSELSRPRICHMHERAIPIHPTVEALDLREEAIETLLCYLELHPRRWLELLPPTYSLCRLRCYGGARQLRDVARSSPPVAVVLARERLAGRDPVPGSSIEFNVVSLSDSMGWEVPLVKRALRQLQWDQRLRTDRRRDGNSGVLVEFGDFSFHFRAYGDLSGQELDSVCDFLHQRAVAQERAALGQLRACFRAFRSVAFQTHGPHAADEEEERSSRLKALLSDYFGKERVEPGSEEEEDEGLHGANLRDWESRIRADIRHFLDIRKDEKFTGRAVARIFHGIGSPCFPAQVYGRDRRFWRTYLHVDFHQLIRMATEEILATR